MRHIREILRQKLLLGHTHRAIAASVGVSAGGVGETVSRARQAGFSTWQEVEALEEGELAARLYGVQRVGGPRPAPDPAELDVELRRKGVTLQLLHIEYLGRHPDGYRYTQFCNLYRAWKKRQGVVMRQIHRGGEKLFVDYSGAKPRLQDPKTGEVQEVELFVAAFGASSCTYAEATLTQSTQDWIRSHERAFEYFDGVPEVVVPDQLKAAVVGACRYEPELQSTYEEFLVHCGAVCIPARQRKPRDKAPAEVAVQVVERWVLAKLRNQVFYSLDELNARIRELVAELNQAPLRRYGVSRRDLFERLDRPALNPLPASRFVYGEWKACKLRLDYHVEADGHYYSAPHSLAGEKLHLRVSAGTIEVWLRGKRITSHQRSHKKGGYTTNPEHMPASHRAHAEWTPSSLVSWACKIGPQTGTLAATILREQPHPERGYRSCLGLKKLEKKYGAARLEAASERALLVGAHSYRHVAAILQRGIDRIPPITAVSANTQTVPHGNVRGPEYYQGECDVE